MPTIQGVGPEQQTLDVVHRFNEALERHDVEAMMALMSDDCIFENTAPAPDGTRYEGATAVRAFWEEFFRASPYAHFEVEEIIAVGDRCVMRWLYQWDSGGSAPGHVRGMDLFLIRGGKIVEKLSYVKG